MPLSSPDAAGVAAVVDEPGTKAGCRWEWVAGGIHALLRCTSCSVMTEECWL